MLIDDHPFVRLGVVEAFKACADMEIAWQAGLVIEARHYLKTELPDAIILDLNLKDQSGLEFIKDLISQKKQIPILVLSVNEEKLFAERCLVAGSRGYLCKTASVSEVIDAVRRIIAGDIVVSPDVSSQFMNRLVCGKSTPLTVVSMTDKIQSLSDRELEVFQMLGSGKSSKEIGSILNISVHTVNTYRKHIIEKNGYHNSPGVSG